MKVFTIDADNNIIVYATKKSARAGDGYVFDSAETLAEIIGPHKRLVEIWNSLTGVAPVTRFTSRAVAAKRIFAELQKLTANAPTATKNQMPCPPAADFIKVLAPRKVKVAQKESKAGSKKEIVVGLISSKNGASLEELAGALAWQKHSVRGFIATLGKTLNIESFRTGHGVRTYKISQAV